MTDETKNTNDSGRHGETRGTTGGSNEQNRGGSGNGPRSTIGDPVRPATGDQPERRDADSDAASSAADSKPTDGTAQRDQRDRGMGGRSGSSMEANTNEAREPGQGKIPTPTSTTGHMIDTKQAQKATNPASPFASGSSGAAKPTSQSGMHGEQPRQGQPGQQDRSHQPGKSGEADKKGKESHDKHGRDDKGDRKNQPSTGEGHADPVADGSSSAGRPTFAKGESDKDNPKSTMTKGADGKGKERHSQDEADGPKSAKSPTIGGVAE